ncbi:MAG: hypothetical protein Q8N54_16750 [Sulfurimicrobium sp.]|jgi:hypothetical protein|nr:hypothetical protein [Sulfurimicrobium sp.]MDO9189026.1 hypothetical protein [Sulfurimicrobium sp.]MDP1703991.1 hypothetical protein [Sulfurimicrobium sp.]MDP2199254.1 hypothetical protein [Sulfurimicrobium sp.]MDP2964400.1 hypothetical protein [Sulfurimicrobium sp.]
MNQLERRLLKLEGEIRPACMSAEQVSHRIDELLAKAGTSREQVIAEHGSLGAYCHWLICESKEIFWPRNKRWQSGQ